MTKVKTRVQRPSAGKRWPFWYQNAKIIGTGESRPVGRPDQPVAGTRMRAARTRGQDEALRIRRVRADDIPLVTALDKRVTGVAKAPYWRDVFTRYGRRRPRERFFLVAEAAARDGGRPLLGFIIGEVRAWEFGSAPCGWIFALSVEQGARLRGVGEALLEAIATEFAKAGVTKVRTMVARSDRLPMLFFRGAGMVAGPYIQLER